MKKWVDDSGKVNFTKVYKSFFSQNMKNKNNGYRFNFGN